ncbi:recombinase RecT [Agrobacterium vaccinii]|uniref:recombinase RecT n=1 Tax=Agrobacterium vaccinii TaxID=2735528 RepID=UPI001E4537AD|nr:recombinase RecT [Agrobacterium vaccinii]UHS60573.1 recombinase RecT [Agrobacterium vaccinii]
MNQVATQQERIPMDAVGVSNTGTGTKIAPQNLGEVVKFAEVMARADIALPKHLRGNAGACMAVALQALEWQMSPFAVASKSYSVGGAIAYEAQLIAAVVNTRSGIKGRLRYQFDGEGPALTCTVTGVLDGEECVYTSPSMGSITTKNSPLWKSDPQQQLGYFAARSWARRHCPEVILGVYDRDEAEEFRGPDKAKNITPVFDPLSDEPIAPQRAADEREGFTATPAADEPHDALTGEILNNTDTDDSAPASSVDAGAQPAEGEVETPPAASPSELFPADRADLIECLRKMMFIPVDPLLTTPQERRNTLIAAKDMWKAQLPAELHDHIKGFVESVDAQIKADPKVMPALREKAFALYAEVLDCQPSEIGGAS